MMGIKKTGWLSGKVLLIPLLVIITACGEGSNEKELMERAKGYLESRDLNAATLELKNILRKDANHAEARYLLGKISLALGDAKTAQKEMRRALDAGWDEAVVQVSLAEVMFRQGYFQKVLDDVPVKDSYPDAVKADLLGLWALSEAGLAKWDDAEQTIKTGESITVDSLWLSQSRIRLAIHRKELQTAGQILEHALKVYPDSQDLWLASAGLADKNGEPTNTIEALQKVIDLDPPRNITAWGRQARLAQGQIWLKQQDFVKAKAVIEPVLKTYPADPIANYLGGMAAFKQGEYDLTEERLLVALKVAPEYRPSLLLFGALDYVRGDYQKAAYYLEKAAALKPEDVGAQTLLGRTYLMLGQYEEAENRLKFASSQMGDGDDAELLALVGISRLKGGNMQAGIEVLEKAAAAAPADAAIRSELAKAYMAAGETERAIKELESALEGKDQQHQVEALLLLANLQAGKFDKALDLAIKLSEKLPDNPLPHNFAGVAQEGKKDFSAARSSYDAALRIQPDNSMALLGIARLELYSGDVEAARKLYQAILDKQPDNYSALVALAKLYAREGKTEKTLELLEKARKAYPTALEPRLVLANYYLNSNDAGKARVYANEALKTAPQDSRALLAVGRAQLAAGEPAALQSLGTMAERLPDTPEVHFYLAQAQAVSGDLTSARKSLLKAVELRPEYMQASYALGNLELRTGNIDAALKISRRLKAEQPQDISGYLLEGDTLMAQSKFQAALSVYESALSQAQDGRVVIRINKAHRANGHSAAGYDALYQWLKNHSDDLAVRNSIASASMSDGRTDDAMTQYEFVLKKQPDNAAVLNDLAWLYNEKGKPGALEMAERANKLAPDNAAIQDTYGWLLVQSGREESGLIALEKAAAKLSSVPSVRYHLAVALSQVGEKSRAKKELDAILQVDKAFPERDEAEALLKQLN
ncbi:MAG: PEP-CTERM system TPR-repeat protein PrsT [Gammaproteobacteria bacterium]|nr:PEP-CTERM system TPR-repeat protein PrsT [Gammaproteobacteria bacterium]